MRHVALALLLLLTATVAAVLLHGQTISYGFDYDDYHFARPYSRAEVAAAFHGPWDSAAIERPYYRPLTIVFYAARFEVLGLNATAHHALSLVLFAIAAALAGWFTRQLTGSRAIAFLTTFLYVVHPAMPYSLVAWITNQMHLVESIVVLSALIWWDTVRRRSVLWWLPLLLFAVVAFLIKEDGIMVLPSIVVLHVIRRRMSDESLPPVPGAFVAAAVIVMAGLIAARGWALAGMAAARRPAADLALANYLHGLNGLLRLVPADRRWQLVASGFVSAVPVTAVVLWRRLPRDARVTMATGLTLALLFNLPFVFITKPEQLHLVALGVVVLLAGACAGVMQGVGTTVARSGIAVVCAAGLASLGAVARDIDRDFEPYGPVVLAHDAMVRGWAAIPLELRDYLERKRSPGAIRWLSPDPSIALELVAFGMHGSEQSGDGVRYRWMSGARAEMLIREGTRKVTIPLRHAIELFRAPARVRITLDGRVVDELVLNTSDWRMSTTAIAKGHAPALTRMHRLVIDVDRVWRPVEIIPGSRDDRTLGLQVGEVQLR